MSENKNIIENDRVLNVANRSYVVYIRSAMLILSNTGTLVIAGLGSAIVTAGRLAIELASMGSEITSVKLEGKEMPGRMLDPKADPGVRKYLDTGKMVLVPRMTVTVVAKTKASGA